MTDDEQVITVSVPKSTHRAFKRACLDLNSTMSDVLRRAIDEAIVVAADQVTEAEMAKYAAEQRRAGEGER